MNDGIFILIREANGHAVNICATYDSDVLARALVELSRELKPDETMTLEQWKDGRVAECIGYETLLMLLPQFEAKVEKMERDYDLSGGEKRVGYEER